MSPRGHRAVVVGAGIVGTSCAFFLQRDGWQVTLVDPLEPGAGTSSGNAGIISLGSVLPVATPGVLRAVPRYLLDPESPFALRWAYLPRLLPWLARFVLASRPARVAELSAAIAALTSAADRAHDVIIQECGLGELVHRPGWLKVARDPATLERATALDRTFLDRHGVRYERLDAAEVHELEPALAPEIGAGLFLPDNRAVRHSHDYTRGILRGFQELGGDVRQAGVRRLRREDGRVRAAETDEERLDADLFVLAAGAFSRSLLGQVGVRVPLDAERGYHVMLHQPEPGLGRPVYSIEDGFVLAPMRHGLRLTGGVELASPTAPPDYRRIRRLVPRAMALLPGLRPEIRSEWLGFRPSLPDSLPVIGPAPGLANLLLAFGHQHIGLTLGPLTGRLIADLAAGRATGLDLSPYRADRRFF